MKVVLLAGGMGTRLGEETSVRPKPMLEIGGKPLLWHIMNIYARHGFSEFVVASGYLGQVIRAYFGDLSGTGPQDTFTLGDGTATVHRVDDLGWTVTVAETGEKTMTGGRIRRLRPLIGGETFMCTYGDGVADVDIAALVAFHRAQGKKATLTAVRPPARFGALTLEDDRVATFSEKPQAGEGWINGGFFVFEPAVLDTIVGDQISMETGPLEALAAAGELAAFRHDGFWQPMDTPREKRQLEALWSGGHAPWKTWS